MTKLFCAAVCYIKINGHIITFKHTEKIRASSKNIPSSPHFLFGGDISTCKVAFQLCHFSLFQGTQLPNSENVSIKKTFWWTSCWMTSSMWSTSWQTCILWGLIFLSSTQVNLTNHNASEIGNSEKKILVFTKGNFFKSHLLASSFLFFVFFSNIYWTNFGLHIAFF